MKHFGLSENIQQKKFYLFFVILGVLIVLGNLFYARSLWLDEAMLALNIVDRNFAELLMPLDMVQVAPIGFLYVEKVFSIIFNEADWSFRIFPMCCFFGAIFLFYKLLLLLNFAPRFTLYATAFFSLNFTLISYALEVKQYASDVFFAVGLVVFALHFLRQKTIKNSLSLALVGAGAIWFSNVVVIVLVTVGVYILLKEFKTLKKLNFLPFLPGLFWLVSFALYYYLFIYNHPHSKTMVQYWQHAFMPLNPFSSEFYSFFYEQLQTVFGYILPFKEFWAISFLVTLFGAINLYRTKQITVLYFLMFPVLIHLLLSGFQLYPFAKKMIIYLSPFIILTFCLGIVFILQKISTRLFKLKEGYYLIPLILYTIPVLATFPLKREEIKPCLEIATNELGHKDELYVYYGAAPAFKFYAESYPISVNKIHYGLEDRIEPAKYLAELDSLGYPNWLLFSHVFKFKDETNEEQYILEGLKKSGLEIEKHYAFKGASLYRIVRTN